MMDARGTTGEMPIRGPAAPTVAVEAWSYLSLLFGAENARRHVIDVPIEDGATLGSLLAGLAEVYPGFGEVMYRPEACCGV